MVQAKRYVFDCVIGLLVLVLCTALLNWWQDPAGAFSDDNVYESTAKALCEGKGLVISGNYDERAFIVEDEGVRIDGNFLKKIT